MRRQHTLTAFLQRLTREGLANSAEGALDLRSWVNDIASRKAVYDRLKPRKTG